MESQGWRSGRKASAPCTGCGDGAQFDAERAYRRLAEKHMQLSSAVAEYMSQAGLDREIRTANAQELADRIARIVGGMPAAADECPDCCLVGRQNPNGTYGWFCSGVLIHPRLVLTAGHCLIPSRVANMVALQAADQNDLDHAELVPIQRMVAHPLYVQTHQFHDISVIVLRSPAHAEPVAVAGSADINSAQQTMLVGFGNSDVHSTRGFGVKRKVTVDITEIRRAATDDLGHDETTLGFDANLEFVAGGKGYDSCNGDSGGPAYITTGGTRKLAGTTSRSVEGATDPCGEGGIYSRVDANLDFIHQTAQASGVNL
jgi:secreted trypsin-like serine protease